MIYPEQYIVEAHKYSSRHKKLVEESSICSCFYCLTIYPTGDIKEWVPNEDTAICPHCGIDSVLPSNSGLPVTEPDFLRQMHKHWF